MNPGYFLLPGGCIRHIIIEISGNIAAAQSAINGIVCRHQVIDGSNVCCLFALELNFTHRHIAHLNAVMIGMSEQSGFMRQVAEIRKGNGQNVIAIIYAGQLRRNICARNTVFFFQVPFAFLAPARTDGAIGHAQFLAVFIIDNRLPFGIVLDLHISGQITTAQRPVRYKMIPLFLQHHQHRHV